GSAPGNAGPAACPGARRGRGRSRGQRRRCPRAVRRTCRPFRRWSAGKTWSGPRWSGPGARRRKMARMLQRGGPARGVFGPGGALWHSAGSVLPLQRTPGRPGPAPMTLEIAIVLLLILINGFFALSEMSVVTSRKARLKQQAKQSRRARTALELAEHPERFLSTVQVGITSIGILTGIFGGQSVGNRIAEWVAPLGLDDYVDALLSRWVEVNFDINQAIGTIAAVAIITYFSIILGELVPKRIALLAPEKIAGGVALPMSWLARIAKPFVWLLSLSTRLILRLLRLDRGQAQQVTEEEIRMLVAESHEQGVIDVDERNMINRVLRL